MRITLAFLSLLVVVAMPVYAQHADREGLRGLTGVRVLIEPLFGDAQATNLTEEQLRSDVELRLRKASVPVAESGPVFLYVNMNAQKATRCGYSFSVQFEFYRPVTVKSDDGSTSQTLAAVWTKSMLGVGPENGFNDQVRKVVADLSDLFLNDYLAANPKKN